MFVRQPANRVERVSQKQVYNTDDSFHKKYGNKNEMLDSHNLPPTKRFVNSTVNSVLHYKLNVDDNARSFCDSVSSMACSNFANADIDKGRKRKNHISEKITKFDIIQNMATAIAQTSILDYPTRVKMASYKSFPSNVE